MTAPNLISSFLVFMVIFRNSLTRYEAVSSHPDLEVYYSTLLHQRHKIGKSNAIHALQYQYFSMIWDFILSLTVADATNTRFKMSRGDRNHLCDRAFRSDYFDMREETSLINYEADNELETRHENISKLFRLTPGKNCTLQSFPLVVQYCNLWWRTTWSNKRLPLDVSYSKSSI